MIETIKAVHTKEEEKTKTIKSCLKAEANDYVAFCLGVG